MSVDPNALYMSLIEDLGEHLDSDDYHRLSRSEPLEIDRPFGSPNLKSARARALLNSILKKYVAREEPDAQALALAKFLACNKQCEDYKPMATRIPQWEMEWYGTLKDELYKFFFPIMGTSYSTLFDKGGVGPGVNVGNRRTDFYSKLFDGPLTTTSSSIYHAYRHWACSSHRLGDAELLRAEKYGEGQVVTGSKLSFVPKTSEIARTICSEPTLNMWLQKGIGELIEERLFSFFKISLASQPDINRAMAGACGLSSSEEGRIPVYATIDLASASDTISMGFLEEFLPESFVNLLRFCRSRNVLLPDGTSRQLQMVSTMGNGFTFPLQTAIFSCIVRSVYRIHGKPILPNTRNARLRRATDWWGYGNYGVFGDDIIVTNDMFESVCHHLELCGFKVNRSKSFSTGGFRESCGRDYYYGYDVRGVYCRSLDSMQSRYSLINRLIEWCSYAHCEMTLHRTLTLLFNSVSKRYLVPMWENDDAGIRCTGRFVHHYKLDKQTQAIKYRRWVPEAEKMVVNDDSIHRTDGLAVSINPDGLVSAFLRGNLGKRGVVGIRTNKNVRYRVKSNVASNWNVADELSGSAWLKRNNPRHYEAILNSLLPLVE